MAGVWMEKLPRSLFAKGEVFPALRAAAENNPMAEFWSVNQTVFFNKSLLRTFLLHDEGARQKPDTTSGGDRFPAKRRREAKCGLPAGQEALG